MSVKFGQHVLTNGAVKYGACVGPVAKQKRHIENFGFRQKVGDGAGRRKRQLLGSKLHGFNTLALATKRTGIKRLHFVAAGGALLNLFGEGMNGDTLV